MAGTGTDETTKACVTLHGDAPMTKKVGEKAPEDNDYDVYEAHVDITPIISRVEIKSLGCVFNKQDEGTAGTPTEHLYTSVTVKGIGMVDYYNMGTLGKDYTTQMVTNTTSNPDGLIYDPEHASVPEGGYKFCGGENASWGWSYDMIGASNGITLTSGDVSSGSVTKYVGATAETQTQNESRTFAYNFFPKGEIAKSGYGLKHKRKVIVQRNLLLSPRTLKIKKMGVQLWNLRPAKSTSLTTCSMRLFRVYGTRTRRWCM